MEPSPNSATCLGASTGAILTRCNKILGLLTRPIQYVVMSALPITFISGEWMIIENPTRQCVNLISAWRTLVGSEPDLGPNGLTVVGVHAPGETPDVRTLRFINATSPVAVRNAAKLVGLKYDCEVEIGGWLRMTPRPTQWLPNANPGPFDLSVLTVWPEPSSRPTKDSVVLELRTRPGHFLGRREATVATVQHAMLFPSSQFAHQFMRIEGIPWQPVQPKWRSVALSEEDQRLAARGDH